MKMTILTTDVHAGNRYTPTKWFDRQVTYYDSSDEYVFEFDTSDCGSGVPDSIRERMDCNCKRQKLADCSRSDAGVSALRILNRCTSMIGPKSILLTM